MGIPVGTSLEIDWGTAMGAGMEQYVDLHMGTLSGPVVPMSYAWSDDHSTLYCTASSPLQHATQYMIHVAGGMVDADGHPIDMDMHGPTFGGQWIQGGMMGGGHGGMPWGMMGSHWHHSNGTYGMAFTFTTA
jgi:ABC-type transport system substrate-binding protein